MWDDEHDEHDDGDDPDDLFECEECGRTFRDSGLACCGQPVVPNPDYA